MDLPGCEITWILLLTVGFNHFNGISALCKLSLFETPSMPLCQSGVVSRGPGEFIYIDTSGAPDFTKVECTCELTFSTFGIAAVSYRVENETFSDCAVNFKTVDTDVVNWGCQPVTTNFIVIPATYKIAYTKSSSVISDWDACIGILPTGSVSVTVKCYPYRLIITPEQDSSTTALTEQTSTTKQVPTEQTSTTKQVPTEQTSAIGQAPTSQTASNQITMAAGESGINSQQSLNNILGPIVGGVIGGVALVALIVIAACFLMWRMKTGENSLGQGKNADFVGKGGNEYVRNRGIDIFLPTRAQQTTQYQEDIDPYDYIDEKHVRTSRVVPTVPPREDDGGYLKPVNIDGGYIKPVDIDGGYIQPADITKVQYSGLAFEREKTDKGENQYILLQPTEGTAMDNYIKTEKLGEAPTQTTADDYLHPM